LFFLKLLHGEDIIEEPFENDSVAVDGYVNLVLVRDLFKAFIKILHVFHQQTTGKSEVSFVILAVVDNVDHYRVLEVGTLDVLQQTAHLASPCGIFAGGRSVGKGVWLASAGKWWCVVRGTH